MSIPIYIPETLLSKEELAEWIEQLPDIIATCAKRWDLRIEKPLTEEDAEMSYGYIAPAMRSDGQEVILKISPLDRLENEKRVAHALQLCDGSSTVKLLDVDEETGTHLLERIRPGVPLGTLPDDDEMTRIAARQMKRFWALYLQSTAFDPLLTKSKALPDCAKNTTAPPVHSPKNGSCVQKRSTMNWWPQVQKQWSSTPISISGTS